MNLASYNYGKRVEGWDAIGWAKLAGAADVAGVKGAGTVGGEADDAVKDAGTAVGDIPGLPGDIARTAVGGAGTAVGGAKTAVGGANTAVAVVGQGVDLLPGIVPGENAACTALRTQLNAFFLPILQQKK